MVIPVVRQVRIPLAHRPSCRVRPGCSRGSPRGTPYLWVRRRRRPGSRAGQRPAPFAVPGRCGEGGSRQRARCVEDAAARSMRVRRPAHPETRPGAAGFSTQLIPPHCKRERCPTTSELQQGVPVTRRPFSGCAGLLARCRRRRPESRAGQRPAPFAVPGRCGEGGSRAPLRGSALDAGQKTRAPRDTPRCGGVLYSTDTAPLQAGAMPHDLRTAAGRTSSATTILWVRGPSGPLPPKAARVTRRPTAGSFRCARALWGRRLARAATRQRARCGSEDPRTQRHAPVRRGSLLN